MLSIIRGNVHELKEALFYRRNNEGLKKCLINTSQSLEKILKIARKWCVSLAPALLETN